MRPSISGQLAGGGIAGGVGDGAGAVLFEPNEENPMIGWRGCSRYYSENFCDAFELECNAIKFIREEMNMKNVTVMLPFCRTPLECKKVLNMILL